LRYNQPFGISDTDAPYINGNPETGTMGSIPPAASIEHPQREIVNFISSSALAPNSGDLRQLAKGIQTGRVIFGVDTGVPNILSMTITPAPDALSDGMCIRARINNVNTGPSVLQINAFGGKQIVHPDQSSLQPGELQKGMYCEFLYDLPHDTFQLVGALSAGSSILIAPRDYYVNGGTGSDTTFDGLTPATPFKTIQKALDVMRTVNTNGWNVEIHIADGSYDYFICPTITGSGTVYITGNVNFPERVIVTSTHPINAPATVVHSSGHYWMRGMKWISTLNNGLLVYPGAMCWFHDIDFGACPNGSHYLALSSHIGVLGFIDGIPSKNYISGNALNHCTASAAGFIDNHQPDLIFRSAVTIGNWANATGVAWNTCCYNSISGAPAAGTTKYTAVLNGIVSAAGKGTAGLPGSAAGVTASGGQFSG
jgi:hypothetical protein